MLACFNYQGNCPLVTKYWATLSLTLLDSELQWAPKNLDLCVMSSIVGPATISGADDCNATVFFSACCAEHKSPKLYLKLLPESICSGYNENIFLLSQCLDERFDDLRPSTVHPDFGPTTVLYVHARNPLANRLDELYRRVQCRRPISEVMLLTSYGWYQHTACMLSAYSRLMS